ncbi:MAG: hypothetical protein WCS73_11645, partial [Lentisphaeria bacterium]
MIRRICFLPVIVFLFILVNAAAGENFAPKTQKILILSSFHASHPWSQCIDSTIREGCLEQDFTKKVDVINFDMIRVHDLTGSESKLVKCLDFVKSGRYNMIIAIGTPIVKLLLKHAHEVPVLVPIVVCGNEKYSEKIKKLHPNSTGILEKNVPVSALKVGLRIYPDTKYIVVLADASEISQEFQDGIRSHIGMDEFKNIEFLFKNPVNESLDHILKGLSVLPKETLLLVSPWRGFQDRDYRSLEEFAESLKQR